MRVLDEPVVNSETGLRNGSCRSLVAHPAHVGGRDNVEGFKVPLHAPCQAGLLLARQSCSGSGDAFEVAFFGRFGDELLSVGHGQFRRSRV